MILKKKLVVSGLVLVLACLIAQPVLACDVPQEQRKWISLDIACPIGESCPEWCAPTTDVINIRNLELWELPIILPNSDSELHGLAWFTINGKVNFETGQARLRSPVCLEFYHPLLAELNTVNDCNGFWGNLVLNAKGITCVDDMDDVTLKGKLVLYGYGLFDGSDMKLTFSLCNGVLHLEGWADVPMEQQELWAAIV